MSTQSSHRPFVLFSLLAVLVLMISGTASAQLTLSSGTRATSRVFDDSFRSSPVMFIENAGQWDDLARFQVWGGTAGTMWLAEDAIWVTVVERAADNVARSDVGMLARFDPERVNVQRDNVQRKAVNIKLSFAGANPYPRIELFDRLDTVVSYFIGNEPDKWRPDVPVWGGVRYVDLYPDVDLEITSEGGQMVQRLAGRSGADLSAVRLRVEGAEAVSVDGNMLRLSTAAGDAVWPLLRVAGSNSEMAVQSHGELFDVVAPFAIAEVKPQSETRNPQAVADNPADLVYSTYLGGNGGEQGYDIAVDGRGSAYVTGETNSNDFPTMPGAFDRSLGGTDDAFVVKLNPTGNGLIYATFLGGSVSDGGRAIAVDASGSAYVTGRTNSSDFPITSGAFDSSQGGGYCHYWTCYDLFVVRLGLEGNLLDFSTFLGGNQDETQGDIAVDQRGLVYVTGATQSSDFPTTSNAFDRTYAEELCLSYTNRCPDAFVSKFSENGERLLYGSFLGGKGLSTSVEDGVDRGIAITADDDEKIVVVGETSSVDFPTTAGALNRNRSGGTDGFVTKVDTVGGGLLFSTLIGGSGSDSVNCVVLGPNDSILTAVSTTSPNFPTTSGAFDRSYNEGSDAAVVQLNSTGSGLVFSTLLGGASADGPSALAVDSSSRISVVGVTQSAAFPTTQNAFDRTYNGGGFTGDAFITRLTANGNSLLYSTFLGGSDNDTAQAIALDVAGFAYVTGYTYSVGFPITQGAFDPSYNPGNYGGDAFVAKLAMGTPYAPTPDGYSFQNRAAHTSWEIFRDTFGAENVEWTIGGVTVARPEAARYYHNHYKCDNPRPALAGWCTETGAGGNCSGMATSSMLIFKGWADPADFLRQQGVNRVVDLPAPTLSGDFWQSSVVADFLVRYQGYQQGRQVKAAKVAAGNQNVSEALSLVKTAIDDGLADPQVISIWGPYDSKNATNPNHPNAGCAGHALMPYAYAEDGAATRVYVYDSNHDSSSPYRSSQFVTFTPSTNTWSYEQHNSIGVWQSGQRCRLGTLTSLAELKVVPLSAWKDHPIPPWDWKGSPTASALMESGWYELAVSPNASLQAIDSLGRVVGNRNGTLALEIPGSALWIPTDVTPGITPSHTEQYVITSSSQLTLKMSYEKSETAVLSALVPEGIVAVTGASAVAGATDTVYISPDARQISVQAGSSGGGRAVTTTRDEDTYGREITIDDFLLTPGASAEVQAKADGVVSFASSIMQPSYGIKLRQAGAVSSMYVADGPSMMANDVHVIRLNWSNPTTATIEIDHGGDGTVDETRVLQNQIKKVYLPLVFRK